MSSIDFELYNKMWNEKQTKSATGGYLLSMDLTKEEAQLHYVVDKFFGTHNGYFRTYSALLDANGNPVLDSEGQPMMFSTVDMSRPNIFARLGDLGLMVCGGTVNSILTNSTVNDLDFYMVDISKQKECTEFLSGFFPIKGMTSINAITMKRRSEKSRKVWTVQLVTKFHGDPFKIFDWFDFTVTHGAYRFDGRNFVFGANFLQDLAKRRLVYSGSSQYPICALYRTKKYAARGYEVPGATLMHIALSIVQLKIETYGQLKEQLMGIDTMYLQKLLDAKDPLSPVNYGEFVHEAFQLIDRISGMTAGDLEEEL